MTNPARLRERARRQLAGQEGVGRAGTEGASLAHAFSDREVAVHLCSNKSQRIAAATALLSWNLSSDLSAASMHSFTIQVPNEIANSARAFGPERNAMRFANFLAASSSTLMTSPRPAIRETDVRAMLRAIRTACRPSYLPISVALLPDRARRHIRRCERGETLAA